MTLDVGISEDHAPRLFLKLQSPAEPSENVAVSGMVASLMMVAHPHSEITVANVTILFIFRSLKSY
jgi:hypothetical protein